MKTLKDILTKEPKIAAYNFYNRLFKLPKKYENISRSEIYDTIISLFKENPEVILSFCTLEEISILNNLVYENSSNLNNGYIEYILTMNLQSNYLIIKNKNTYYIPEDILNYVKMALNLFNEKEFTPKDITDSVILGLIRIYNVLPLSALEELLNKYHIVFNNITLKEYLKSSFKLKKYLTIIKQKNTIYVVSTEYFFYKDILPLIRTELSDKDYLLEEVLSIGKYRINLFNESILKFLSFLEMHLPPDEISEIVTDLIIYCGFDINDESVLLKIAGNINELYEALKKVVNYFPVWIYKGNDLTSILDNLPHPSKDDPCPCGSGKKYKKCCGKKYFLKHK